MTDDAYDPLEWWKCNASALPHWSKVAQKMFLLQPSSAATERVFSLLKSSFNDQQDNSLKDYIESSLMLQYYNKDSYRTLKHFFSCTIYTMFNVFENNLYEKKVRNRMIGISY